MDLLDAKIKVQSEQRGKLMAELHQVKAAFRIRKGGLKCEVILGVHYSILGVQFLLQMRILNKTPSNSSKSRTLSSSTKKLINYDQL